jgi:hypothetical protein
MIAGVPPRLFITPPIKADGLFPEVCVNERFIYGDRQNPDTQRKHFRYIELAIIRFLQISVLA